MSNYNTLADDYARAKAEADAAAKKVEALRQQLLAIGDPVIHGQHYDVAISTYETNSLIRDEVEKRLTSQQLARCTKTSKATRLTVKAAAALAA